MSPRMSRLDMQLAPIPTFPRKQGKEFLIPSPACGGGPGWGRDPIHFTPDFASTPTLAYLWGSEELVKAYEVMR